MDKITCQNLQPIEFDFDQNWVPPKAKKLKPGVFRNGDSYCCLFGPDPEVGIYGCGDTPGNAVLYWTNDLEKRIERLTGGDDAAHQAVKHLGQH